MMTNMSNDNSRNLLVIKASAGSGKTYNLALQYIKHLLYTKSPDGNKLIPRRSPNDDRLLNAHRLLLAITFTNKATDEMKDRIVGELYKLSLPETDSDYLEEFMSESGMDEASVRELARLALNELLFDYSNFNVSTIDSFFQSILRNFARELDRDFNYDIQLEEKYAVGVAVHKFLLSLGHEEKPTQVDQWVKEYQRHMIRGEADTKKWKFFDDGGELNQFAQQINSETFRERMADIRDYLGEDIGNGDFKSDFSRIRAFKKYVHDVVADIQQEIEQGLAQLMDTLTPMADGLKNTFKNWVAKGELVPLSSSLESADEEKIRTQFKKGCVPEDDTVITALWQLVNRHFSLCSAKDFFKHIEDNLGLLGMLAMIDLYLERYRHETNSILIGDTNELIGTVLESGSDFVYERVGTTIAHFMIDEFQDTSTKQYENFRGLLSESLASGNFNMLIGDAKQSIYRFRNADPTVFREKVDNDFRDHIFHNTSGNGDDEPNSTNYRSSRHIIEFNNDLFEFMSSQFADYPTVQATYRDVRQAMPPKIDEKKVPGYVRLFTGDYRSLLNDDFICGAMLPADMPQDLDEDQDVDILTVLPAYLQQLHLRYDWGRIGILVNTNNQGNKVVERILEYNQQTDADPISIISGESLLLNNSPIIRRVIAMLRFIDITQYGTGEDDADDTDQEVSGMMNAMARRRYSDQRLYNGLSKFINTLAQHADADAVEAGRLLAESLDSGTTKADMEEEQQAFARTLARLLPSDGELTTLVSIVETIISHFKSDVSTNGDVDRETAFLFAFQDTVMQFCSQRNGGSIREFLKFWDEKKDKLAVSSAGNGNAVNIMTIHAAKGLEFDCVVLPYANWELEGNSQEKNYWMPCDAFISLLQSMRADAGVCDAAIVPPLLHVDKKSLVALDNGGALQGLAHDFVAKQQGDVLIDNLNKTYVAMTRPRSELHIFAKPARRAGYDKRRVSHDDERSLMAILTRFGKDNMTPMVTPTGTPDGWFELGEISTREELDAKRQTDESDVTAPTLLPLNQYTVNPIPLKVKVRVDYASSTSIDAGLRLHGVLSHINDCNDVDNVISQAIKHGVITDDSADPCGIDSVNAHVVAPIKDPASRVAAWFDPANKVYSERTITTASDSIFAPDGIENLRPDRIVRRPEGTILVIDYKSGERRDKQYSGQVQRYIDKLRLIFPDVPIAGRIWYVTHDLILDVDGKELSLRL
jgi:ATP-dependent exoDNAse (exonuclease V) beta subunit